MFIEKKNQKTNQHIYNILRSNTRKQLFQGKGKKKEMRKEKSKQQQGKHGLRFRTCETVH